MFCGLSYLQDKGALEDLEKYRETILQRIRQRQGCEEKQPLCLHTVGRRRRRSNKTNTVKCFSLQIAKRREEKRRGLTWNYGN